MTMKLLVSVAIGLSLLGCRSEAPAPVESNEAQAPAAANEASNPSPGALAAGGSLRAGLPAEGAITYQGLGPAHFGAPAEAVRQAWGGEMRGEPPEGDASGCYYLVPQPMIAKGSKLSFLIEYDRFARIDVRSDQITAPGGGKVGMERAALQRLYGDSLQVTPHKYVDGAAYLSVAGSGEAPSKLIFETDASDKVSTWRVGVSPQVDYVEGCS